MNLRTLKIITGSGLVLMLLLFNGCQGGKKQVGKYNLKSADSASVHVVVAKVSPRSF